MKSREEKAGNRGMQRVQNYVTLILLRFALMYLAS